VIAYAPAEAFELFVDAYSRLECAVLPGSRLEEVGGLPALYFAGLEGGPAREVFTWGRAPAEVIRRLGGAALGPGCWLTCLTENLQADLAEYLAAGFRHRENETVRGRGLSAVDALPLDPRVERVRRAAALAEMNALRGYQVYHPIQLEDPHTRIFRLVENGRTAAWGTLLLARPGEAYFANMYTLPEFRRKGYARAILSALLAEAVDLGARRGLLISTAAGLALYRLAGFERIIDCLVLDSPG